MRAGVPYAPALRRLPDGPRLWGLAPRESPRTFQRGRVLAAGKQPSTVAKEAVAMKTGLSLFLSLGVLLLFGGAAMAADAKAKADTWSMNATIIEACSCPMFCQCYFSAAPAGHAEIG